MTQKTHRIEIDLVPLTLFSQRISEGWTMVPGYPLQPDDYAVTMMPPNFPDPRTSARRATLLRSNPGSDTALQS